MVLNVYEITIDDENNGGSHTGEVTIKIKITEEMKKYNSFKLICIDEDTIGKNDVIDLKIEGDYLVGNLYHLSKDAVGGKYETSNVSTNPKTGDNITLWIGLALISFVGIVGTRKLSGKKKRTNRH